MFQNKLCVFNATNPEGLFFFVHNFPYDYSHTYMKGILGYNVTLLLWGHGVIVIDAQAVSK